MDSLRIKSSSRWKARQRCDAAVFFASLGRFFYICPRSESNNIAVVACGTGLFFIWLSTMVGSPGAWVDGPGVGIFYV